MARPTEIARGVGVTVEELDSEHVMLTYDARDRDHWLAADEIYDAVYTRSTIEGDGSFDSARQIWRRDGTGVETTVLGRGVSIDIPVGTAFQYRCTGVDPLQFLCITMPRWPGDKEATVIEGPWKPTAPEG